MNEFIKILLSLSVSGTLLLLFVLGLKQIYRNKFSMRWQYYIWIIVVLRFLLPFTFHTMNVRSVFEMFRTTAMTSDSPVSPDIPVITDLNDNEPKQLQTPANENIIDNAATKKPLNVSVYLFFIWSAAALILLIRKITVYQGFIQYIKAGSTEVSDIKILNLLSDCEEKLNVKKQVELYTNALITSPMMIGFFRPRIVLPARTLEDKELSHIFAHELMHYKQRDMFYKWLIQVVICIHWFNPFVYLLEKEVNRACELSCDEAVISVLDDQARREYGDTLIRFLKPDNLYKSSLASVTLTEGAEQLKERLGVIMNFKKKSRTIRFLTGILTLCIIWGAAFAGVYPVAAANHLEPAQTDRLPIPEEKKHNAGTYVYDENMGSGWYLDDNGWDWDDEDWDFDWDWDDEDWDFDWDDEDWDWDDDKAFSEIYAAYGIEKNGKSIYYQGELIYVFLDHRPDRSFYRLNINPEGTASIQVIHDKEGKITGVSYMTEEEVTRFTGEPFWTKEIPVINTREWDSSGLLMIEAYYKTDNIYILPSTSNKVILKEYLSEDQSGYYADTELKNNVLTIHAGDRPTSNYKSYIEIYIPDDVLGNVKIETVSGTITVDEFTGVVELSTISGGINMIDSDTAGSVDTVSGSIELYPSDLSGDLYVNSHSGKISAVFPVSASYNIKAETKSGEIKGSYSDTQSGSKKEFSDSIGRNPKVTITLKTFSANIEIY